MYAYINLCNAKICLQSHRDDDELRVHAHACKCIPCTYIFICPLKFCVPNFFKTCAMDFFECVCRNLKRVIQNHRVADPHVEKLRAWIDNNFSGESSPPSQKSTTKSVLANSANLLQAMKISRDLKVSLCILFIYTYSAHNIFLKYSRAYVHAHVHVRLDFTFL